LALRIENPHVPSQANARRLVDAYLAESVSVSKLPPPRLREVPSATRLYAAEPRLRLAVAIEGGHRIAKMITHGLAPNIH
jgi:hypothetical protein